MNKILLICITFICISELQCKIIPARLLACWPDKLKHQNFPVEFYLSSRLKVSQKFRSNADLEKAYFNPQRRTVLVIHGLGGSSRDDLTKKLRNGFLNWNDVNVVLVNWEQGSSNPLIYHLAVVNTEYVAWRIRDFFKNLFNYWEDQKKVPRDQWGPLHFIGISLGAHVAGQSAELLKREDKVTVDRVTGLDPAEPCFEDVGMPLRLNQTNARFVDVIHTDGARKRNAAFGLLDPLGHADFYVNGGSIQPGCEIKPRNKRYINYLSLYQHTINNGNCHHLRSLILFNESLKQASTKQCKFWAHPWRLGTKTTETNRILQRQCDTNRCSEMGINAELYNYETRKIFYVSTTGKSPFCNI